MKTSNCPIVVLVSGHGSNLQAIIDAIKQPNYPVAIKAVISDKANAHGLLRAQDANIVTEIISANDYPDRVSFDKKLQAIIDSYQPQLVVLAGFMRILTADLVRHYQGRMINIHPSLLPKYRGLNTHAQALAAKDQIHGCSIHFVTAKLDAGPIICYSKLTIKPDDTKESLKARVQQLEHQLYPKVIKWIASNRLRLTAAGVEYDGTIIDAGGQELSF